jgi:hypothetical protein
MPIDNPILSQKCMAALITIILFFVVPFIISMLAHKQEIDDDECNCVLPSQSCNQCRTKARQFYGRDEEIPFY